VIDPVRVRLAKPVDGKLPNIVYDSPHSGQYYPPGFATKATQADLRRGEDAYVNELLAGAPERGAHVVEAVYARCYIDVNREETDIDAAMLSEPWSGPLAPTEKSARGLGLIRRYVVPAVEVNAGRLSVREVQSRIENVYRPYHVTLATLVKEIREQHDAVWHINWHSMKSVGNAMTPDGAGAIRRDFVVSDLCGKSSKPDFTNWIVDWLRARGYSVGVNDPYRGGVIIERIGAPLAGIHSIQIEINRSLYLDEARVEKTPGFKTLATKLDDYTRDLARFVK